MTPEQQLAALYIVAVGTISLLAIGGLVYVSYRYDRAVQALAPDDKAELRPDGGVETGDRERHDECPECGTIGYAGWVLGHHYCPDCDHTFGDDGEVLCEGRYLDSIGNENTDSDHREGPP